MICQSKELTPRIFSFVTIWNLECLRIRELLGVVGEDCNFTLSSYGNLAASLPFLEGHKSMHGLQQHLSHSIFILGGLPRVLLLLTVKPHISFNHIQ